MSETEIIGDNGDVWKVRECDGEDGCVVLERFSAAQPNRAESVTKTLRQCGVEQSVIDKALADMAPDPESEDSIHIPADVLPALAQALSRKAGRP
jgi:hypothetical protein